jgi:hypothetical protein
MHLGRVGNDLGEAFSAELRRCQSVGLGSGASREHSTRSRTRSAHRTIWFGLCARATSLLRDLGGGKSTQTDCRTGGHSLGGRGGHPRPPRWPGWCARYRMQVPCDIDTATANEEVAPRDCSSVDIDSLPARFSEHLHTY